MTTFRGRPRSTINKIQAITFWEDLQNSTEKKAVIRKHQYRQGYESGRTLERYAQAAAGFRLGLGIDELGTTGWGTAHLEKVRSWWDEWQREDNRSMSADPSSASARPLPAEMGRPSVAKSRGHQRGALVEDDQNIIEKAKRETRLSGRVPRFFTRPLTSRLYQAFAVVLFVLLVAVINHGAEVIAKGPVP